MLWEWWSATRLFLPVNLKIKLKGNVTCLPV